jgi:DNA-binding LacI/PurR family transcriptional regulator
MIYILGSSHVDFFKKTTLPYLNKLGTPFVVIHSIKEPLDCPNIGLDCVQAGVLATDHLLDQGYRTIGCIRRGREYLHAAEMYQGYLQTMKAHGLKIDERFIFTCPAPRREEAYEWADRLLKEKPQLPEALVITGDPQAEGIVKRFREAGIQIPGDLAVVGFGNAADPYHFPLTTIYQPSEEKGEKAAEMMLGLLDQPGKEGKPFYCFEPELIVRETSLKPS